MTDWGMSGRVDSYDFLEVDPFTLEETGRTFDVADGAVLKYFWSLRTVP